MDPDLYYCALCKFKHSKAVDRETYGESCVMRRLIAIEQAVVILANHQSRVFSVIKELKEGLDDRHKPKDREDPSLSDQLDLAFANLRNEAPAKTGL